MGKNDLDGQLNLFGSDPYQPKKAKANEEQVELSTEAEEFLSVGRRKKKAPEEAPTKEAPTEPVEVETPVEEAQTEPVAKKKTTKKHAPSGSGSVVMQQSFVNGSGKTATVAYVDYNCVYVDDLKGGAVLIHYQDAKTAVDQYLETVARLAKTDGLKKSKEHPALRNVPCREAE